MALVAPTALRDGLARLERARILDRVGDPLRTFIDAAVPRRVRDLLHGSWLGHPVHPVAVQIPAGAWSSAAILDFIPGAGPAATLLIAVGTASAVPAAATGLNDWASLTPQQRRIGLIHATGNLTAVACYTASLAARLTGRRGRGRRLALAGLAAAGLSAYLGGHLSYSQGAAVNQAAPLLGQITDGWHDAGALADLREGAPATVPVEDVPVLLYREGDAITAMIERCAHQSGPLGDGKVTEVDGAACVVCPWHGSTFRLRDGAVVHGPAASDQPRLRTRVRDGRIEVSLP
jgi:nitrite reductase/ring-hydroxylating ferredoxin subunit